MYEASAKMLAVTRLKSNLDVPVDCTFEEYLNINISEDKIVETAVLPSSISSQGLTKPPPPPPSGQVSHLLDTSLDFCVSEGLPW